MKKQSQQPELNKNKKDNYIRNIIVTKIVDWDTVYVNCDLWFDVRRIVKVRLWHIQVYEKDTDIWQKAIEYLSQFKWSEWYIESLKYDKYWRWLCELFINWNNISDELIHLWYWVERDGKWAKPL
jgi:hypothetical protein